MTTAQKLKRKSIIDLFSAADDDGSGEIDAAEFYQVIQDPSMNSSMLGNAFSGASEKFFKVLFEQLDDDGNGELDKEEFIAAFEPMIDDNGDLHQPTGMIGAELFAWRAALEDLQQEYEDYKGQAEENHSQLKHLCDKMSTDLEEAREDHDRANEEAIEASANNRHEELAHRHTREAMRVLEEQMREDMEEARRQADLAVAPTAGVPDDALIAELDSLAKRNKYLQEVLEAKDTQLAEVDARYMKEFDALTARIPQSAEALPADPVVDTEQVDKLEKEVAGLNDKIIGYDYAIDKIFESLMAADAKMAEATAATTTAAAAAAATAAATAPATDAALPEVQDQATAEQAAMLAKVKDQLDSMIARHEALQLEVITTAERLQGELDRVQAASVTTAEELERALADQAERLEEQSSQLDDQDAQLRELSRENSRMTAEVSDARDRSVAGDEESTGLRDQLAAEQAAKDAALVDVGLQRQVAAASSAELLALAEQIGQLTQQNEQLGDAIAKLRQDVEDRGGELQAALAVSDEQGQTITAMSEASGGLQTEIAALMDNNARLTDELTTAVAKLDESEALRDALQAELASSTQALRAELAAAREEHAAALAAAKEGHAAELAAARAQYASTSDSLQAGHAATTYELKAELASTKSALEAAEAAVDLASQDAAASKARIGELESVLEEQASAHRGRVTAFQADVKRLADELKVSDDALQKATAKLEGIKGEIAALQTAQSSQRDLAQSVLERVARAEADRAASATELTGVRAELAGAKEQRERILAEHQASLESAAAAAAAAAEDATKLTALRSEHAQLKGKHADLEGQHAELGASHDELQSESESIAEMLRMKISDANQEIGALRTDLASARSASEDDADGAAKLARDVADLEAEREALAEQVELLEQQLQQSADLSKEAHRSSAALQRRVVTTEEKLAAAQQEVGRLTEDAQAERARMAAAALAAAEQRQRDESLHLSQLMQELRDAQSELLAAQQQLKKAAGSAEEIQRVQAVLVKLQAQLDVNRQATPGALTIADVQTIAESRLKRKDAELDAARARSAELVSRVHQMELAHAAALNAATDELARTTRRLEAELGDQDRKFNDDRSRRTAQILALERDVAADRIGISAKDRALTVSEAAMNMHKTRSEALGLLVDKMNNAMLVPAAPVVIKSRAILDRDDDDSDELKVQLAAMVAEHDRLQGCVRVLTADVLRCRAVARENDALGTRLEAVTSEKNLLWDALDRTAARRSCRLTPPASPEPEQTRTVRFRGLRPLQSTLANRLGLPDSITLLMSSTTLWLADERGAEIQSWPLAHLKKFGMEREVCSLELGHLSNVSGVLHLDAGDVAMKLFRCIACNVGDPLIQRSRRQQAAARP